MFRIANSFGNSEQKRRGSHETRRYLYVSVASVLACSLFFPAPACALTVDVTRIATGLDRPLFATTAPGNNNRLFIVEQHTGQIKILNRSAGTINGTPFLTVGGLSTADEQGMLGLAFHPNYQSNGQFYVNYTDSSGTTNISRFIRSGNPDIADPTEQTVLTIPQFDTNHNGGWIEFNPIANAANDNTNYLYIGVGDGGGGNDPGNNGQNTNTLLGTILRIDVDGDDFPVDPNLNYAVPASNPFSVSGGAAEVWSYGLRNPFRNGFDRTTGDLYIADVGQVAREEIDVQPATSSGGENYGWRLREGLIATPSGGVGGSKPAGAIDPIHEYGHTFDTLGGFAVIGGYVYRGPNTDLPGKYFFADNVTDNIWSLEFNGDPPASHNGTNFSNLTNWNDGIGNEFVLDTGIFNNISSFGEDNQGNLFIVSLDGHVYEIVPEPSTLMLAMCALLGLGLVRPLRRRYAG